MALKAVGINCGVKALGVQPSVPGILIGLATSEPSKGHWSAIMRGDISIEGAGTHRCKLPASCPVA